MLYCGNSFFLIEYLYSVPQAMLIVLQLYRMRIEYYLSDVVYGIS